MKDNIKSAIQFIRKLAERKRTTEIKSVPGRLMFKVDDESILCPVCNRNEWNIKINGNITCSVCLSKFVNYGVLGLELVEASHQNLLAALNGTKP